MANALPTVFGGFIDPPGLTDGELSLVCVERHPATPAKKYVPAYAFEIRQNGECVGQVSLRIGYTGGLYYGGQIGYAVDEAHRGRGIAGRACRLLIAVMRAHGFPL